MKQRGRRNSKVLAAEVVDLVSDPEEEKEAVAAAAAPVKTCSRGNSRGKGRAAATAAAAAIAGSANAAAQEGELEFVDSDFELEEETQLQQKQQQASATQGRKRALPASVASRGSAANGSAPAGLAAKRARTVAAAAGGKGGSRATSSKGSKAAVAKSAAARGFNALFLCASQRTGGSQGSAEAGGSQQAAAGAPLPLTRDTSAAPPAAAAAAGGSSNPAAAAAELWVEKYTPRSVSDLVVHKKKVAEVQDWLTFYIEHRVKHHTRALLVTGPPGCGKSVTVRLVAESLGFEVMEWTPPVPTLWADHQYMAGAGVRYTSKLDEFDMFVARCKFAALPLTCNATAQQPQQRTQQQQQQQTQQTQASQQQQQQQQQAKAARKQKLILVEDLPHVVDSERRMRVASALHDLATTARCPVVVIATTEEGGGGRGPGGYGSYGAAGAGVTTKGLHKDFVTVLDQSGAGNISFNPLTGPNLTKALAAIAESEGYRLDPDMGQGLVAGAGGDLRNAVQNLQLMLQGPGVLRSKAGAQKSKSSKAHKRPRKGVKADPESAAAAEAAQACVTAQVSRDQSLSVYHAIGKLLHYKRNQEGGSSGGGAAAAAALGEATQRQQQQQQQGEAGDVDAEGNATQQQDRLPQPPLRINPEGIIHGSGLEALQVTAFLAENYTHFMLEEAMDEAAEAAAALSDAGYMCCYRNSAAPSVAFWDESDPNAASLASAAAVSVAARGLLWANRRPAASRWLPLKGPSCYMPERAASSNMTRLAGALQSLQDEGRGKSGVLGLAGQLLHAGRQDRAAQVLPYLQVLGRAPSRLWLHALLPRSWAYMWQGSITERPSPALQGQGTAAVAAALEAAVAAAAAAGRGGGGVRGSQGGGPDVLGGVEEEAETEESEEIESGSE